MTSTDPKLDVGHLTHAGRVRERNEDGYGLPPTELNAEVLAARGRLFIVADGMGGHTGGERASQLAVQIITQEYYSCSPTDPQHDLARAILLANAAIHKEAQNHTGTQKMGTTVTAAVVRGRDVLVANVGDSRAYLLRDDSIKQLTRDHSLVADGLRDGTITPEQAAIHPYRSVITRALGVKESVKPDFFKGQLKPGDSLLLCSDGLTNELEDNRIAHIMSQGDGAQVAASNLVDQALGHGGRDNVTALIVSTAGKGGAAGAPAASAGLSRRPPNWLFTLAGAAVALVLVLAGVLMIGLPSRDSSTPPTGAHTSFVTTAAPESSSAVVAQVEGGDGSGTPQATAESQGTTAAPSSGDSTAGPAEPSEDASPPPAADTATPTASPRPTRKPAPTRTPKPTLNATKTPSLLPPPLLDEPEDGASVTDNDTVVLRWHWTEPLRPDDHFDVLVWREGKDRGSVAWTREPVYHLHIPTQDDRLTMPELKGAYYWSVVVVHGQTAADRKVVSVESNTNIFIWKGHTGGDDEGPEPPPGSSGPVVPPPRP